MGSVIVKLLCFENKGFYNWNVYFELEKKM